MYLVLENIIKLPHPNLNYIPFKENLALYLNKLKSPSRRDALY